MEINYDLIIKYLLPVKKEMTRSNFLTDKYNMNYNLPKIFIDNLSDKFFRQGVTIYDDKKNNISFWTSLITILDKSFTVPYNSNESFLVSKFISELLEKKKTVDMKERIKLLPDIVIFEYVVDVLEINILILDFKNLSFNVIYPNLYLNPWNKICILANFDDYYEPIMNNENRFFTFDNEIIKNLFINNNIQYYQNYKEYKIIKSKDEIKEKEEEYIKINQKYKKSIDLANNIKIKKQDTNNQDNNNKNDEIEIKKDESVVLLYNENDLNKKTVMELSLLMNDLGIKRVGKMLKKDLIEKILEKNKI